MEIIPNLLSNVFLSMAAETKHDLMHFPCYVIEKKELEFKHIYSNIFGC